MSIVKMKRLRLIGLRCEQDELLARLLHLGCVEVTEAGDRLEDPQWAELLSRDSTSLGEVKSQANALNAALDALRKYAPAKGGLFIKRSNISEADFLNPQARAEALEVASQINQRVQRIAQCYTQENRQTARRAGLSPWVSLDLPLELTETESTKLTYVTFPSAAATDEIQAALAQAAPMAQLFHASTDKELHYYLLVCHKEQQQQAMDALKPFSMGTTSFKGTTGTASENLAAIDKELGELAQQRESLAGEIASYADQRPSLQVSLDRLNQEVAKEAVRERTLTDGTVVFLEGWVSSKKVNGQAQTEALKQELSRFTCAYELTDPEKEETPPTELQNPKWMDCINMVTEMYSLPAYDGIDPNPLMFFWYIFFFGFMFADVAYGIIIFCICFAVTKLYHPKKGTGRMFQLGMWLGGTTAFCGLFVGGFFGNLLDTIYDVFLPNATMPCWMQTFSNGIVVNPIADPMTVLILAVAIGCVQLIMGQCIHIYMGFRDGTGVDALLDVVPWWVVFVGIAVIALAGNPWVLLLGALLLLVTQGRHAPSIPGKIMGGLKSWYDITSWLSDVLSYARLMALMLATSVIAMVFNTLGALVGRSVVGVIVFIVVFLIGHVFNIGVNIIGTYVHAARLQYLEYFGKFYKDGGIPFRPLKYDTKYVDIID
jgi:V/A-type H+-transporting ATPase subunit I